MRAGKHVFCEKPLTHNIWEAWQVAIIKEPSRKGWKIG
jgi:predicted dehydrogenase